MKYKKKRQKEQANVSKCKLNKKGIIGIQSNRQSTTKRMKERN